MLALIIALAQLVGRPTPSHIPSAERQALLDLFQSTKGTEWTERTGWKGPEGSECKWFGISCWPDPIESGPLHVLEIRLPRNNLRGAIPASLASLASLMMLDVSGNGISMPLPDAVVERWNAGLTNIETGGPFQTFEEIRLSLSAPGYCVNEAFVFRADGSVSHFSERCHWRKADKPEPYCEVRRATTEDFLELSRFLMGNGIFDSHEGTLPPQVDGGTTTVSVKGQEGIHSVRIFDNGRDFGRLWSYEMVIRGVAAGLTWGPSTTSPGCPWTWRLAR